MAEVCLLGLLQCVRSRNLAKMPSETCVFREIRRTVVYDPVGYLSDDRPHVVSALFILSYSLAASLCTPHETKGSVTLHPQRVKLTASAGFSPHEAHAHQAFFGWIMPTIRTSEFTVLQIVGLDAAVASIYFLPASRLFHKSSLAPQFLQNVLLSVLSMLLFCNNHPHAYQLEGAYHTLFSCMVPTYSQRNKDLGEDDDGWPDDEDDWPSSFVSASPGNHTIPISRDWLDLISDANSYLSLHLMFTYLFTLLALYFIYKNYRRFIRSRQLFSLELVHSIPARTVLVTNLPNHLQGERPLAEYFENMGLLVESVTVCREVGSLKILLDRRTRALLALERAWVSYVGNPSSVEEYDPEDSVDPPLVDVDAERGRVSQGRLVVPHRKRPTMRPGWFKPKVDALEYLETQFREADELVKKRRKTGKFKATQAAFVTFEKMSSAVSFSFVYCSAVLSLIHA